MNRSQEDLALFKAGWHCYKKKTWTKGAHLIGYVNGGWSVTRLFDPIPNWTRPTPFQALMHYRLLGGECDK